MSERHFSWQEDIEPYFQEIFLIKHGEKATWSDIVSFPVNTHGYNVINDLIECLKQMRDFIEDVHGESGELRNMGSVQRANKRVYRSPQLLARKSHKKQKASV